LDLVYKSIVYKSKFIKCNIYFNVKHGDTIVTIPRIAIFVVIYFFLIKKIILNLYKIERNRLNVQIRITLNNYYSFDAAHLTFTALKL